jgi:outer membrane murein-binding lipoprotein Lpp
MRWSKVLVGGAVVMAALTSGCAGGDSKAACDTLQQEIPALNAKAMQQINDPDAMSQSYKDSAAKFRSEGAAAGGDVKAAAEAVATELDGLGKGVEARTTQMPNMSGLISAGTKLKDACG